MSGAGPLPGGEDDVVERLQEILRSDSPRLLVPAGHDCAAVSVPGGEVVITTDVLIDGVHFDIDVCGPEAAGAKSLLVNLSDLAASAAQPLAFEIGVVLPRDATPEMLDGLARGLARVASTYGCPCAGGDTNVSDGPLVLALTVLGVPGPTGVITRHGAVEGDVLSVTGPLGGSARGRHLGFVPRLAEARVLAERGIPHAMMDLSDGLSVDLPRLCRASGVGARIEAGRVPVHTDVAAVDDDRSPLEHALHDGEDFELLVAHAPLSTAERSALAEEGVNLHTIGRVLAAEAGVLLAEQGRSAPLAPGGYDHFRPRNAAAAERVVIADRPEDMLALGRALATAAHPLPPEGLTIALLGELGAGKTVLVKGIGEGLGLAAGTCVVSPTFTIARSYEGKGGVRLHHIDAYRLGGAVELEDAGFEDMCGPGCLTCVEWAERVRDALPEDRIEVTIAEAKNDVEPAPGTAPRIPRRVRLIARGPVGASVLDRLNVSARIEGED